MNYTTATDFEVNKRLATLMFPNAEEIVAFGEGMVSNDTEVQVIHEMAVRGETVDYCNDWAAIGPLFENYYDDINHLVWYPDDDVPEGSEIDLVIREYGCGLKRAAAICIIKILEGE